MMFSSKSSKKSDKSGQFIVEVKKSKKRLVRPNDASSQTIQRQQDRSAAKADVRDASVFRSWAMPEEAE